MYVRPWVRSTGLEKRTVSQPRLSVGVKRALASRVPEPLQSVPVVGLADQERESLNTWTPRAVPSTSGVKRVPTSVGRREEETTASVGAWSEKMPVVWVSLPDTGVSPGSVGARAWAESPTRAGAIMAARGARRSFIVLEPSMACRGLADHYRHDTPINPDVIWATFATSPISGISRRAAGGP